MFPIAKSEIKASATLTKLAAAMRKRDRLNEKTGVTEKQRIAARLRVERLLQDARADGYPLATVTQARFALEEAL